MTLTLIKTLGGSRAYGLDTPESDIDYRGVFLNTDPAKILGLEKLDHVQKQEEEDEVYYEVRKFFDLLRNGNTGALEILFTDRDSDILDMSTEYSILIRNNRYRFVDTDKMFKCLRGYMQGERRLANGERTGQLGSKRKAALEKYGFSPKNFVQLFRLAECGVSLFKSGEFPVHLGDYNEQFRQELLDIKVHPEKYTKEYLNLKVDDAEKRLVDAYEHRQVHLSFNTELANDVLRRLYLPYLNR